MINYSCFHLDYFFTNIIFKSKFVKEENIGEIIEGPGNYFKLKMKLILVFTYLFLGLYFLCLFTDWFQKKLVTENF